ncbi:hypothetical protein MMAN_07300 [Mycobacterium mantenii]|uniref:Uncharacterized protein n=1 Tax=Mycobacterium mantenii TaxID=560555 RepID=A0ABN6A4S8_MYCNT|nr:hypothetical protein MMAN_07300 [Mycobacterium mantenii]
MVCVVSATRITRLPFGSGCTTAVAVASGGGPGGGGSAYGGGGYGAGGGGGYGGVADRAGWRIDRPVAQLRTDPAVTVGGAVGGDDERPDPAAVELGGEQIG